MNHTGVCGTGSRRNARNRAELAVLSGSLRTLRDPAVDAVLIVVILPRHVG
jgi:hypothetical protein